ncbi:hypothetical protein [Novipirellula rosea]|uniref:Uncharacterized protein n=1 Tax=Novipirellula rosea TaxID=1031540 RepID=A0ABP8MPM5_9BACT
MDSRAQGGVVRFECDPKYLFENNLPMLDLGEVVGISVDQVFFGRSQRLSNLDYCQLASLNCNRVAVAVDSDHVLLIGPGLWETQIKFAWREVVAETSNLPPSLVPFTVELRARVVYGNRCGSPLTAGQLFDAPIDPAKPMRVRRGEVLSITFRIYDLLGNEVTSEFGGGPHCISRVEDLGPAAESVPGLPVELPSESSFRYQKDDMGSGRWSCELSTATAAFVDGHTYELQVRLNDGSLHACRFEFEYCCAPLPIPSTHTPQKPPASGRP